MLVACSESVSGNADLREKQHSASRCLSSSSGQESIKSMLWCDQERYVTLTNHMDEASVQRGCGRCLVVSVL